ncbi:hypothetical protein FHR84_003161 [Actinopolyspora biskrensis]|uniref:Uncharacterized protein n=1 Tax=Actinopolyspora biskrensis TaxID=1470178 RepID=A0A852ZCT9_9ACTN|nr:hypothetical protein [Actinopolyspora biskrensis]NYH79823.1 hypothetical protein [Actinopolyspora biskrensis]
MTRAHPQPAAPTAQYFHELTVDYSRTAAECGRQGFHEEATAWCRAAERMASMTDIGQTLTPPNRGAIQW